MNIDSLLKGLSPAGAVIVLILIIVATLLTKYKPLLNFIAKSFRQKVKITAKLFTCSYCINTIIGMRERYESEISIVEKGILRKQMNLAEVKIQEILQMQISSFRKDMEELKGNNDDPEVNNQILNYIEAMRSCLNIDIKNEVRRSFKENGFSEMAEREFHSYSKDKGTHLISIAKEYMEFHYPRGTDAIISLGDRFEKLDKGALSASVVCVYEGARDAYRSAQEEKIRLKKAFSEKIDAFTNQIDPLNRKTSNT